MLDGYETALNEMDYSITTKLFISVGLTLSTDIHTTTRRMKREAADTISSVVDQAM